MAVELSSISLPKKPGVYLFKNRKGRVLYVGKATKLSERIRSYFAKNPDRAMIPELVKKSDDIECIVTASPHEALILERQLIREHKPRYNSIGIWISSLAVLYQSMLQSVIMYNTLMLKQRQF